MLDPAVRWRLDKDEVSSIFTRMRCNLMGKRACATTLENILGASVSFKYIGLSCTL